MAIEYGLKSFKWKAIGGETLESLGKILVGTSKFTSEAPGLQQFYAAQNPDYPSISLKEKAGLTKIDFTLMEIDADVLVKLFGGVATGVDPAKSYAAPRNVADIHGMAELVTESGLKITIPKAYLVANFNWDISRTAISQIAVTITIELPDLETDMPYTIAREV
jgi:hypothetical protein